MENKYNIIDVLFFNLMGMSILLMLYFLPCSDTFMELLKFAGLFEYWRHLSDVWIYNLKEANVIYLLFIMALSSISLYIFTKLIDLVRLVSRKYD